MAGHLAGKVIGLRTQFDVGHVFQAQHVAVGQRANNDIAVFRVLFIPTPVFQRVLENIFGVFTQNTCSGFDILFVKHVHYVGWHQSVLRHHVGLQPDAHGVFISHDKHLAHTGNALYLRLDVNLHVVTQEVHVVITFGSVEYQNLQLAALPLLSGNANLRHFGRQRTFGF